MNIDQLPGLAPLPKKRGRPVTGKAKTPAERKAAQRAKLDNWLKQQVFGPEDFRVLELSQLVQALPVLLARRDYEASQWCAECIPYRIRQAQQTQPANEPA